MSGNSGMHIRTRFVGADQRLALPLLCHRLANALGRDDATANPVLLPGLSRGTRLYTTVEPEPQTNEAMGTVAIPGNGGSR